MNIILSQTYGPFMRSYSQPTWAALSLADRARLIARQGHQFATSLEVRVVYPSSDDGPANGDAELVDVPKDGKTVGEIVTRGNITMKEVRALAFSGRRGTQALTRSAGSITATWRRRRRHSAVDTLGRVTSRSCIPMGRSPFLTEARISLSPAARTRRASRSSRVHWFSSLSDVYANLPDAELASHPDVLECAVVARAHPRWGERAMAFVVLRPAAVDKWAGRAGAFGDALKRHARARLPGFACPEWVEVVAELPKTSTGKIQKVALRREVAKL